jgi:hypothetical protein
MATRIVKEKTMTRPLIQIDDEVREMNDDEFIAYEANLAAIAKAEADAIAKAEAKAAIAERLGLTDAELALLLG